MHRCSESIGTIAGALAKAQAELSNPQKTLSGTIMLGPASSERSFRYAPLSAGLEIVRTILGKHEIATVQTTGLDTQAGLVRLTTMLAHSSGEWISSEWPVCGVSETATPRRMGAALTYARRYALFTLVGIAGEDDLDAPDAGPSDEAPSKGRTLSTHNLVHLTEKTVAASVDNRKGFSRKPHHQRPSTLPEAESVATRQRLSGELAQLTSAEQLTTWAARQLPIKNNLAADDARIIETLFQAKLNFLTSPRPSVEAEQAVTSNESGAIEAEPAERTRTELPGATPKLAHDGEEPHIGIEAVGLYRQRIGRRIDKSLLTISEPRRLRDKAHLKFVGSQGCLVCGREPSDAHHLRFAQLRALGRKVSDQYTVPLCRTHHREVHHFGKEPQWWRERNIDPVSVAQALWLQTHPHRPGAAPNTIDNNVALPSQKPPCTGGQGPSPRIQGIKGKAANGTRA